VNRGVAGIGDAGWAMMVNLGTGVNDPGYSKPIIQNTRAHRRSREQITDQK
jgi:hypothetical protein